MAPSPVWPSPTPPTAPDAPRDPTTARQALTASSPIPTPDSCCMTELVVDDASSGTTPMSSRPIPRRCFDEIGDFNEARYHRPVPWNGLSAPRQWAIDWSTAREVVVVHPPRTTAREILRKSRRVAQEGGALRSRRLAGGISSAVPATRLLIPRHSRRGRRCVRENGAGPSRFRSLLVGVAQVLLLQAPQALTTLFADVRATARLRPRR